MLPDSVLAALRKFDTPTILNVIELFDALPRTSGYTDRRITACFPHLPPMVGYAVTATFRAASKPRSGDGYAGLDEQIRQLARTPGPKVVVFQDLDDPPVAATFGEIMATTYQAFGCVGLVSSGGGRDLDQIEPLKFPCFTGGTIPSHGYTQIVELNVPVRVGGVWVHPGDLLHGDRNGITTIPVELADLVAEGCAGFMDAEKVMLDYLRKGGVTAAGFGAARDEAKRLMGALGERLRAAAKGR
jgi:4-hydroxy-4-methyl-2-oxoglutarate aldolase